MQYIKFIIAGCVLAVALCGCGRQVKLLTSETQTETQMMDDAGGEETVVSSAEAFATTTTEAETPEQEQSDDVAVYVCGAVRQPGVYYVAGSAIRETAVQMAGGFTDDADVTYVNLAQTVVAGEQIYIPTMEETNGISLSERDTDGTPVQDAPAGTNVETDGKININTAGKDALMTLPGIGESKADAIIAYREAQGKFQNTEELMNIRGIKEGIYNKIKDLIIVGEVYRMKKILVVDDEKSIVKGIKFSLEQDDMKVEVAYDGETALELAKANHYDMILLDIMLPGFSGLEVCQMIREFSDVPIIMLTAKGDDMDKILGLEYGADDYITKPFNILEVKARIKAIFRRNNRNVPEQENQKVIETKGLKIDVDSRRVYIDDKEVNLTAKEFELVYLLVSNPNKVYSREQLLKTIWGPSYPGDARTVDVHVRRLREKIEATPADPKYIHTKWGVGYYFHE